MNTINSNKQPILLIALVILLVGLLTAGCAGLPAATSVSTQPAQATANLPNVPAPTRTQAAPTLMVTATQPVSIATTPPQVATAQVSCTSPAGLTPAETEGPYFKAGSPETASIYQAGMPGTQLVLTGYVLTADCKPVAHALLDFWQADSGGNYDNSGYTLRGHQYTDDTGRYQLVTVVPGLYPGRTEHIHVKVQAPNGPLLTTQLFFPGVQSNDSDSIFNASLVMTVEDTANGVEGQYNFIVAS